MNPASVAAFDRLAASYDAGWTFTPAGILQRQAVWRQLDPLIERGQRILDLGCGTGEDAVHFTGRGASVLAVDAAPGMVKRAAQKGVNAHVIPIGDVTKMSGSFDLVLSNFGALNCLPDLSFLRAPLARLIPPGGHLAICLMGRFCVWESLYYAMTGKFRKAARRWRGTADSSLGLRVYYPLARSLRRSFAPEFEARRETGVGVFVPPSFVRPMPAALLKAFGRIDRRIAGGIVARSVADHRLVVFRRR